MSGIFDQVINYAPPSLLKGTVTYKGTWSAATNTPTLINPPDSTTNGFYYVVSAAGTQFSLVFNINDWIISNGSAWQKVDNTDSVDSVFGRTGAVVGVSTDYSSVGITATAVGASSPSTGAFTTLSSTSTTTLNSTTIPASKTLVVTTDKISVLAATTSAELAGVISDETGSGSLVFATLPTFGATGVKLSGSTSGTTTVLSGATAGTSVLTLPVATDTLVGKATTDTLTNKTLTSPTITTPVIAQINDASGNETLKLASIASAVNEVTIENAATGSAVHISATGGDASVGLHLAGKGASGYVNVQDSTDATKRIMFNASGGTTNTRTMLSSTQTVDRTLSLPDATDTLVGKATTDTLTNKTLTSPTITGGALNGTLGATTPSSVAATTGTFSSTLGVTGVATLGNGAILGTPASGTVTNLTGTASININGTVGATTPSTGAFSTLTTSSTIVNSQGSFDALTFTGSSSNSMGFRIQNAYTGANNWNVFVSGGGPAAVGSFGIYDDTGAVTRMTIAKTTGSTVFSGGLNSTAIGASSASTGAFTTGGYNNASADTQFIVGAVGPSIKLVDNYTSPNSSTKAAVLVMATTAGQYALADGDVMLGMFGASRGNLYLKPNYSGAGTKQTYIVSALDISGNTAITGTLSSTTGANFATSSGSVGIGTTSPSTYVSDGGLALLGLYGTSSAAISIYNNSSASATNIAKIDFRLNNTFSGTGPCAAIYGLNPNAAANNGGALVFSTSANGTSTTPTERMRIDSSGNVGIGTASPEKTLHVVGNGKFTSDLSCDLRIFMRNPGVYDWALRTNTSSNSFEIVDWNTTLTRIAISTAGAVRFNAYGAGSLTTDGSGNITAVSDERIKSNIRPFSRGLSDIIAINPILHGYTEGSGLDQSRDDYAGFSAQQVQPLIPEAIGVNADGMLSFSDRPIIAALVNAVKELSARLAALESK